MKHIFFIMKERMMDNIGFVEWLETFGDDLTVVNAARVSFDKVSTELTEGDKKLIQYLAKHDHISPFFHPQVRFRIKMPIFVAREWYRHTIGFARNEVSRRYVDSLPECWVPHPHEIRERDQGETGVESDTGRRIGRRARYNRCTNCLCHPDLQ
jgi:thymidylate synthase (FAD)